MKPAWPWPVGGREAEKSPRSLPLLHGWCFHAGSSWPTSQAWLNTFRLVDLFLRQGLALVQVGLELVR